MINFTFLEFRDLCTLLFNPNKENKELAYLMIKAQPYYEKIDPFIWDAHLMEHFIHATYKRTRSCYSKFVYFTDKDGSKTRAAINMSISFSDDFLKIHINKDSHNSWHVLNILEYKLKFEMEDIRNFFRLYVMLILYIEECESRNIYPMLFTSLYEDTEPVYKYEEQYELSDGLRFILYYDYDDNGELIYKIRFFREFEIVTTNNVLRRMKRKDKYLLDQLLETLRNKDTFF